jgi:TPR repeat protein/tRNA A-37 threonylcarbamoyl transferase component Bud32
MINTFIGKYKITRLIGEGGMAFVYEAEHEMLQTKVAIKVLKPMLSANSQIKERFKNEAKLMANLDHPNITKVIDFDEQPEGLSIIMEFLNGEDLNQKIKRSGPITDKEIIDLYTQILSACQYAHKKGIVHRDIKPSNIFILPNGHLKILDFGIAKLFGLGNEMTHTGTQIGTPIYMSPEQVKADKSIDHRSDIYSLGVTLYYAINGKPPYSEASESQFDIFNKIVFEPLPNGSINKNFDEFIKKACQKNREHRFQSCDEWIDSMIISDKSSLDANITIKPDSKIENNRTENNSSRGIDSDNITRNKKKKRSIIIASSILTFLLIGYFAFNYYRSTQLEKGIEYINANNHEAAFDIFNSDLLKENAEAQYYLGRMYSIGQYVERNSDKAFILAKKSADQNNAKGLNLLGTMYSEGQGTEKNMSKAIKCFTDAANYGNAKGYFNLGEIYFEGEEVIEKDYKKALKYYSEAINLAKGQPEFELSGEPEIRSAVILRLGGNGVDIDIDKAKEYYLKAIERNNSDAAVDLGWIYESGEGVEQNYFLAFKYYKIAAKSNNPQAQSLLGSLYLDGRGCTQDEGKALELFKKSAEQENDHGLAFLGYMYENNRGGVGYDIEKARQYYRQAAELGNEWAKTQLGL